jgi:hypothetical protein
MASMDSVAIQSWWKIVSKDPNFSSAGLIDVFRILLDGISGFDATIRFDSS